MDFYLLFPWSKCWIFHIPPTCKTELNKAFSLTWNISQNVKKNDCRFFLTILHPFHPFLLLCTSILMKKKSKKKKKVVILECWNRTVLFHLNPLLCLLCAEIITSLWYSGNIFSEHTIHQELRYSLLFTVCTCQNLPIIPYIQLLIHMFLKLSEVIRQENLFFFLFKC